MDSSDGRLQCRGQILDCVMLVSQNQLLQSSCILFHLQCAGTIDAIIVIVDVHSTILEPSAPFPDMLHSNSVVTTQLYQLIVNFTGGDTFCQQKLNYTTNCLAGPSPMSLQLHTHLSTESHMTESCAICCMLLQLQVLPLPNIKHISYRLGYLTC